ncbi:uncharacterized protein C14orf119 homolog [Trichomycterus rosablanca]|uniref:uncharacterized protein C14orf119 homolog n=1 Tax=Trichomycterus rosablanca TaxID=2290929 RepID=UPI002F351482
MAWFHHVMQDACQPQLSSVNDLKCDGHECHKSNPSTNVLVDLSDGQSCLQSSNIYFDDASQSVVLPSLGELSCISSFNLGLSDGPVPLSYVTLQEQRCVLNWFFGWGPSQRKRFLEDLISKAVPRKVSSLLEQLNTLQVKDRPPNIFECQIRLWTQWFESWSEEERNAFLTNLEEKDPNFVAQFFRELASTAGNY